jgi:hypothetical protein
MVDKIWPTDASPEAVGAWTLCNHRDTEFNCKWHGQIERFLVAVRRMFIYISALAVPSCHGDKPD